MSWKKNAGFLVSGVLIGAGGTIYLVDKAFKDATATGEITEEQIVREFGSLEEFIQAAAEKGNLTVDDSVREELRQRAEGRHDIEGGDEEGFPFNPLDEEEGEDTAVSD